MILTLPLTLLKIWNGLILFYWNTELFRCFTSSHYFQVLDVCTRFLCRSASLQLSSVFRVCCFWEHLKQALLTVISRRTDLLKDSWSYFSSGARSRLKTIFKEMWYLWFRVMVADLGSNFFCFQMRFSFFLTIKDGWSCFHFLEMFL